MIEILYSSLYKIKIAMNIEKTLIFINNGYFLDVFTCTINDPFPGKEWFMIETCGQTS